jgi:alpha-acetolactate decarboxylase
MLSGRAILTAGLFATGVALAGTVSGGLPQVTVYGTIRQIVRQRDVAAKVELAEVLRTPHAFGLGSLSDLRGEITIVDGTAWLSYPPAGPGGVPRVVASSDSPERAGFLVTAPVEPSRWREVQLSAPISSDNLESVLVKLAAEKGLAGVDLPFRIDGHFATLTVAIIDGRKLPPGPSSEEALKKANHLQTEADVAATLVGFLAAKPDERFTHPRTRLHVHAVVEARRMTGHAQGFRATAGVRVWLPDSSARLRPQAVSPGAPSGAGSRRR